MKVFLRNVAWPKLTFSKRRVFCMGTHTQVATAKSELHAKRNMLFVLFVDVPMTSKNLKSLTCEEKKNTRIGKGSYS